MKITVDTTQDSVEDIKRVIKLLNEVIDQTEDKPLEFNHDVQEETSPEPHQETQGFQNLFSNDQPSSQETNEPVPDKVHEPNVIVGEVPPERSPIASESHTTTHEPIADKELFNDLFTDDEMKKMDPHYENQEVEKQDNENKDSHVLEPY